MKKVGLFVDLSNIYYSLGNRGSNNKLNYATLVEYVKDFGNIHYMYAYGAQMNNEAINFIKRLETLGFNVKYKNPKTYKNNASIKRKADWDVGICIDIVDTVLNNDIDIVVIGSADGDLVPLVEWLLRYKKQVIIIASKISKDLRTVATTAIEIPESFLEGYTNAITKSERSA